MHRLLLALAVTGCWTAPSTPPPEQPKQAKIKDLVQPVKIEKQEVVEEGGEEGGDPCGVSGGVVGGVVGGVPGGTVAPPPPPPPPSAPPQNVAPTLLEGNRIAGNRNIIPNDVTKVEIMQAGKTKIIGSWKLCIADTGDVTSVTRLKSSGFADYDRKIETEMRTTWRYRPYLVNGRAVPVCTAVTYIYSQEAPTPPPAKP